LIDEVILGRNPVIEALKAGRNVTRILLADRSRGGPAEMIAGLAARKGIRVDEVDRSVLDRLAREAGYAGVKHQGVIAYVAPVPYADLDEILRRARDAGDPPLVVALDGVEDPRNLGAIIRTAEAASAHGVIIPRHRSAGLNAVVARASAGAVEHIPVARVTNLSRTLNDLKSSGMWVVGLDPEGSCLWDADLTGPMVVVVGGEGKGMGRLIRECCDFLVGIPMLGRVSSLNASVAAALVIYEAVRQRSGGKPHHLKG